MLEIRDNIHFARQFVDGITFEEFKSSRVLVYAVTRALEIVSEAVRRLPADMRERHPALPWRAIMGVGNVYRHEYDDVAEDLVWRTLHGSLDPLMAFVAEELQALDS